MCGRCVLDLDWAEVLELLGVEWGGSTPEPSWNVAPTDTALIVRTHDERREAALARWGLVPGWAKDVSIGSRMFNARSETAHEKPAFRAAFQRRRCVVPTSGFYEWQKTGDGKRPWYIVRADERALLCAGLWDRWTGGGEGTGEGALETFTILTTAPNAFMQNLHDRMPCVLEPEAVGGWLAPGAPVDEVRAMLAPAAEGVLIGYPVSRRVGNVRHNDASLTEPAASQGDLF